MRIAVLAVQGAFIEHEKIFDLLGAEVLEIRQKKDLDLEFHGLVLPGGESTVMGKLLKELDLLENLKKRIETGMPVFGTCAGLILLAEDISNDDNRYFSTLPVTVKRNAYGRQLGSFYIEEEFKGIGNIPMTFIRAPYIESVKGNTDILAVVNGKIVAVRKEKQLGVAFHPELSNNRKVHQYFLDMCSGKI